MSWFRVVALLLSHRRSTSFRNGGLEILPGVDHALDGTLFVPCLADEGLDERDALVAPSCRFTSRRSASMCREPFREPSTIVDPRSNPFALVAMIDSSAL